MFDVELDEEAIGRKPCILGSRWHKLLGWALVALLGSYLLGIEGCSRRPYTCAACRLGRADHRCLGLQWSDRAESDCSRWYRENVERSHAHDWVKGTYCRRFGIPGLSTGYACYVGGPLTTLSRTLQIEIYRHFEDRLEAKRLFIRLGQTNEETHRIWAALMGWVDGGYPGNWHDWWEKHRTDVDGSGGRE